MDEISQRGSYQNYPKVLVEYMKQLDILKIVNSNNLWINIQYLFIYWLYLSVLIILNQSYGDEVRLLHFIKLCYKTGQLYGLQLNEDSYHVWSVKRVTYFK